MTPWELPIVVACRDLTANTVGQLPMVAYRGNVPRPDQPAIVVRPDPFEPRHRSLERLVYNLTGWGYVWLIPSAFYANDQPAAVRVVDASRCSGVFDPSGRLADVYWDGRRLEPGPSGAIWIAYRTDQAGTLGTHPLAPCWRAGEYLASLYDMAGSFWEAGFPSVGIGVDQVLNPTQTAELKAQVLSAWSRKHEPAIIDRGGRIFPVGSSAVESQLVESINTANAEVARAFGVMPSLVNVGGGDSLTYATTEGEFSKWLKTGLGPYLTRIEAGFSDLVAYGTNVRFDTTELLRSDLTARFTAYESGIRAGWMTVDEVRAREGLAPLGQSAAVLADPPESQPIPTRGYPMQSRTVARAATLTSAPVVHTTVARRAQINAHDDATRALDVCLVPWGEVARVSDDGRTFYEESWEPGSLVPGDHVAVFNSHRPTPAGVERGALIGVARDISSGTDGLRAVLSLADTTEGRNAYNLAVNQGHVRVSIEADIPPTEPAPTIVRTASTPATLTGVAVIWAPDRGAYAGAIGAARSSPDEPEPEPDEPPQPDDDSVRVAPADLDERIRTAVARYGIRGIGSVGVHPLARYGSFDELHAATRSLPSREAGELSRAFNVAYREHRERAQIARWVNQITTDNPGVMPPSWLTETFGIVDRGRPSITALGGPRSAGDSGMDVNWPYYDGNLTTIVGEQAVQKTEITSVLVSFKRGTATLKTYAGGSDVSYQLQRRSSPSYMALYDRILQIAYGITTENAFVDALVAGAGSTMVFLPLTANAAAIRAFLFGASARVRTATGSPATAVLTASDVYLAWGSLPDLMPPAYGTQNVSGTAQASSLQIDISGLNITEAPMAPAGSVVVTNELAASWLEEGPFLATAEDVQKLGTDVAIWGMGAPGLFLPTGIVKAVAVAGDDPEATSSRKK